jgi:hypothetical protein
MKQKSIHEILDKFDNEVDAPEEHVLHAEALDLE